MSIHQNEPPSDKELKEYFVTGYSKKELSESLQDDISDFEAGKQKAELERLAEEQNFRKQLVLSRDKVLHCILTLMVVETGILFVIVILASLQFPILFSGIDPAITRGKILDISPTTLHILVGATVTQVSAMTLFIIRSLYSPDLNRIIVRQE